MFKIQDRFIDTTNETDKKIFGNYYEKKLFNYLKKHSKYQYEMISGINEYSLYDFKSISNNQTRIIELRSRLNEISNFKYELFNVKKFKRLMKLYEDDDIIEVLIYFCHINKNNYRDFKFYAVDIKHIDETKLKINIYDDKELYLIPINYLKEV